MKMVGGREKRKKEGRNYNDQNVYTHTLYIKYLHPQVQDTRTKDNDGESYRRKWNIYHFVEGGWKVVKSTPHGMSVSKVLTVIKSNPFQYSIQLINSIYSDSPSDLNTKEENFVLK